MDRSTTVVSRWLFLRLLGVVYLIAFVSLGVQALGLFGSQGIVPVANLLERVGEQLEGLDRFRQVPTLCWIDTSDGFLTMQWVFGAVLSVLLVAGVAPVPVLLLLWVLYLSLVSAGGVFFSFQWDVLLLETGLLAVLFAPGGVLPRPGRERAPSRVGLWLLRLLLFKLMFLSGVVKLTSGDATWLDLTALTVHYETQPLPAWTSWFAHQLPLWFMKVSMVGMFVAELVVPFLVVAPRRLRHLGAMALIAFQLLIAATGNYGFFNLLTIVLCLVLLDDGFLRRFTPAALERWIDPGRPRVPEPRAWQAMVLVVGMALLVLSGARFTAEIWSFDTLPRPLRSAVAWVSPLRSVNGYGLFRVMTTTRPEIEMQGSYDGENWKTYTFRWKPNDVARRPGFVAPHMPRVDWQMWFAALGTYQRNPWFIGFVQRLLEGSPEVLGLLESNPFPNRPPRFVRAVRYTYRFTDVATRRETGAWWERTEAGLYAPPLSLSEPKRE